MCSQLSQGNALPFGQFFHREAVDLLTPAAADTDVTVLPGRLKRKRMSMDRELPERYKQVKDAVAYTQQHEQDPACNDAVVRQPTHPISWPLVTKAMERVNIKTAAELARKAKLSTDNLSKWKHGKTSPDGYHLAKLSQVLGLPGVCFYADESGDVDARVYAVDVLLHTVGEAEAIVIREMAGLTAQQRAGVAEYANWLRTKPGAEVPAADTTPPKVTFVGDEYRGDPPSGKPRRGAVAPKKHASPSSAEPKKQGT